MMHANANVTAVIIELAPAPASHPSLRRRGWGRRAFTAFAAFTATAPATPAARRRAHLVPGGRKSADRLRNIRVVK